MWKSVDLFLGRKQMNLIRSILCYKGLISSGWIFGTIRTHKYFLKGPTNSYLCSQTKCCPLFEQWIYKDLVFQNFSSSILLRLSPRTVHKSLKQTGNYVVIFATELQTFYHRILMNVFDLPWETEAETLWMLNPVRVSQVNSLSSLSNKFKTSGGLCGWYKIVFFYVLILL